jgi:hypothetical protein
VVVAVPDVGVVQVTLDEVVDMIAVGHGRVAAARPVDVRGIVRAARVAGLAAAAVRVVDGDDVLVHVVPVDVVEVAVVQIVDVPLVLDSRVAAARAVRVRVSFVHLVLLHRVSLPARFTRAGRCDVLPGL